MEVFIGRALWAGLRVWLWLAGERGRALPWAAREEAAGDGGSGGGEVRGSGGGEFSGRGGGELSGSGGGGEGRGGGGAEFSLPSVASLPGPSGGGGGGGSAGCAIADVADLSTGLGVRSDDISAS